MAIQLFKRGAANVSDILPKISRTILEVGGVPDEDFMIDLSIAENWLIRDEILEIQKTIVLSHEVDASVLSSVSINTNQT